VRLPGRDPISDVDTPHHPTTNMAANCHRPPTHPNPRAPRRRQHTTPPPRHRPRHLAKAGGRRTHCDQSARRPPPLTATLPKSENRLTRIRTEASLLTAERSSRRGARTCSPTAQLPLRVGSLIGGGVSWFRGAVGRDISAAATLAPQDTAVGRAGQRERGDAGRAAVLALTPAYCAPGYGAIVYLRPPSPAMHRRRTWWDERLDQRPQLDTNQPPSLDTTRNDQPPAGSRQPRRHF
jgi:hypothetical protein